MQVSASPPAVRLVRRCPERYSLSQAVETERLRIALRGPQAVPSTGAVLWRPERPTGASFVLAHGAGTDLTHPLLRALARGLAERGHETLTFNFAYTEAGRKRPDPMPRLEAAYADVVAEARTRMPDRPLVLGGRSMGGRVATHLAAKGEPCDGLALFGYPLHPAGRPDKLRTGHWPDLKVPMLFVTGDRDRLCDLELFEIERRRLVATAHTLHVLAGADHGFRVRASDGRTFAETVSEAIEAAAGWAAATFGAVPPPMAEVSRSAPGRGATALPRPRGPGPRGAPGGSGP